MILKIIYSRFKLKEDPKEMRKLEVKKKDKEKYKISTKEMIDNLSKLISDDDVFKMGLELIKSFESEKLSP
jgi:hypothetical protein